MILNKNEIYVLVVFLFLVLLVSSMVSAGVFDWFKKEITGKATDDTTSLNITVGIAPTITFVDVNETVHFTVTENGEATIVVNFTAEDTDGVGDIVNTSAEIVLNRTGEGVRQNVTCAPDNDINSATSLNFSCSVKVWYYDTIGDWSVNVTVKDANGGVGANTTTNFTLDELTAMKMAPTALTWGSLGVTDTNTLSSNDPIVINNTGNDNSNNVAVTGTNLHGEVTTGEAILAANFTVHTADACDAGTAMVNNSAQTVSGASVTKGNHSANDGSTGQEQLYFCIEALNSDLSSQSYSSSATGEWTIALS